MCPITIVNLLFANLEMGGGGEMAGGKCPAFGSCGLGFHNVNVTEERMTST